MAAQSLLLSLKSRGFGVELNPPSKYPVARGHPLPLCPPQGTRRCCSQAGAAHRHEHRSGALALRLFGTRHRPRRGPAENPCPSHCAQHPGTAPLARHHPAGPLLNLRAVVLEHQGLVPRQCSPFGVLLLPCSRLVLCFWLLGWARQSAHRPDCARVGGSGSSKGLSIQQPWCKTLQGNN